MELLTNKRGTYFNTLMSINPHSVATFSEIKECPLFDLQLRVLMNTNAVKGQIIPENWSVKSNNKIHLKVAIGTDGIYIGSWNFSKNSTYNFHEAGIVVFRHESQEAAAKCDELEKYFESLWSISSEVQK